MKYDKIKTLCFNYYIYKSSNKSPLSLSCFHDIARSIY